MKRPRKLLRLLGIAAVLTFAAGLVLPRLNADRFGNRLKRGLEEALGRRVEIGKVRMDLFNGPGFSIENVIIHEDPAVGIEPFAYVKSLEARVSFKSAWAGRLEFSSLRLVEPSVNLARPASGAWNFVGLLTRTAGAEARGIRLPEIQVRGGRINFKFGDTKSTYYLLDASLDASPPSLAGGRWRLRFEGEPARTDRPAIGFGTFSARGWWRPEARTGGEIDVALDLQKSPLAELIRLTRGYDLGLHGKIAAQATLKGPVSAVEVGGWLQLFDLHRWDLLPPHTEGWRMDYRGRLDLTGHTLELETDQPADQAVPVWIRLRADQSGAETRWGVIGWLRGLSLKGVPELARHMGMPVPADLTLEGELAGGIGYSPGRGFQGTLVATAGALTVPDAEPVRFERAEVVVDGSRLALPEAVLTTSEGERLRVSADYLADTRALSATFATPSLRVAALAGGPIRISNIPILENLEGGAWKGRLSFRGPAGVAGRWAGNFEVAGSRVAVAGLSLPLEIDSARVALGDGGAVVDRLRGRAGELEFAGEYHYRAQAARPHRFRIAMASASAAGLERVLLPTLQRSETLLRRALRLGRAAVPEWLGARQAEGSVEIGALALGDIEIQNVAARLRWDGPAIDIFELAARLGGGLVGGRMSVDLRRALPVYRLSGRFHNVAWMGGTWDGKAILDTWGAGDGLIRNLRINSSFAARAASLLPETEFTAVSGQCVLTAPRGAPRLVLSDFQATLGEDVFQGQGTTGSDGKLILDLTSGPRQMRLGGTLSPFQLDLLAAKKPG